MKNSIYIFSLFLFFSFFIFSNMNVIKLDDTIYDIKTGKKYFLYNDELKNGRYKIDYEVKKNKINILGYKESELNKIYYQSKKYIKKIFTIEEIKNFVIGLFLGEKILLDKTLLKYIKELGLLHILAISGMHFNILNKELNKFLKRFSINIKIKTLIILIFITLIVVILYSSPYNYFNYSILRTYYIFFLYSVFRLLNLKLNVMKSLLIFLFFNLCIDYKLIYNLSFVLTISITILVIHITNLIKKYKNNYLKIFLFNIYLEIYLIPINLYFFGKIYPYSFILNLIISFIFEIILSIIFLNMIINFIITIKILNEFISYILLLNYNTMYVLIYLFNKIYFSSITVTKISLVNALFLFIIINYIINKINSTNSLFSKY